MLIPDQSIDASSSRGEKCLKEKFEPLRSNQAKLRPDHVGMHGHPQGLASMPQTQKLSSQSDARDSILILTNQNFNSSFAQS
jgi:hypothetical protein